jgi:predicted aconitase with swiveling domain
MVTGRVIVAGAARGELLRLSAPISFWGGVDPVTGLIADPRHPQHGVSIAGRVLAVPSAVGSSSSSAIMLELLRENTAPAALLLGSADAIVALGVVVAGELGLPTVPVLEVPWEEILRLPQGPIEVEHDGTIRTAESS